MATTLKEQQARQAVVYDQVVRDHVDQDRPYSRILDLVPILEDKFVLDLGCGTGYLTSLLAERVGANGRVLGVDPDSERIKVAKMNVRATNVTFLEASGESFPEDQYDVVFSNIVMGSIENKQAVFERVSKNLCPGGKFVLGVYLSLDLLVKELTKLMGPEREKVIAEMWHHVPAKVYEDLAQLSGLVVTKKEEFELVYCYPGIDAVIRNWYAATHGNFDPALVDPEKLKEFKEKYSNQKVEKTVSFARFVLTK